MGLPCLGVPTWFRTTLSNDFTAVYTCHVSRVLLIHSMQCVIKQSETIAS